MYSKVSPICELTEPITSLFRCPKFVKSLLKNTSKILKTVFIQHIYHSFCSSSVVSLFPEFSKCGKQNYYEFFLIKKEERRFQSFPQAVKSWECCKLFFQFSKPQKIKNHSPQFIPVVRGQIMIILFLSGAQILDWKFYYLLLVNKHQKWNSYSPISQFSTSIKSAILSLLRFFLA